MHRKLLDQRPAPNCVFGSVGAIKTINTFGYSLERRFYHTATSPSKNRPMGSAATGKCTGRVSPRTLYNEGSAVHSSENSPSEWRRDGRHCKHNNGVSSERLLAYITLSHVLIFHNWSNIWCRVAPTMHQAPTPPSNGSPVKDPPLPG